MATEQMTGSGPTDGRTSSVGQLLAGLEAAAIIDAASSLGLLDLVRTGASLSPAEVAVRCGLDRDLTELLVDALEALEVVTTTDRGELEPGPVLAVLDRHRSVWGRLVTAVRSGSPSVDVTSPADAEHLYAPVVDVLEELTAPDRAVVSSLLAGCGPHVVDLGAGTAPWSRALAAHDDRVTVTAVDLPRVTEATRKAVAANQLGNRFRILGGDLFSVDLPDEQDLVLVAQVCRLFAPEDARRLVRRAASLARPGGTVAVIDVLPDQDRDDGRSIAVYRLGLALRTSAGRVHDLASYRAWFRWAGLVGFRHHAVVSPGLTVLMADRPTG